MNVIIFNNTSGVAVLYPADCGLSVLDIGLKDVPAGLEFWIVDSSQLPDSDQRAWELDHSLLGEPAGVGGTYQPEEIERD